ncbi:conserved Plasmodium protein, unknown function [Plasmodium gallinaceum]|uniref:Uncharacterized protein n=1 Tax=Plasmodium gallinaceum TaxID=5849 RepID=A0A1J1GYB3_PLAGA|nr:conserved Plasmodium protein, unknown function [Plasmodium gallinaceum]CRG96272.1 conserved Plasmodium protein, unknown function [Plasmodium gallinaceum]
MEKSLETANVKNFEKKKEKKINEEEIYNEARNEESINENTNSKNIASEEQSNVTISDNNSQNVEKKLLSNNLIKKFKVKIDTNEEINILSKNESLSSNEKKNVTLKEYNVQVEVNNNKIDKNEINISLVNNKDEKYENTIRNNKRKINDETKELTPKKLKIENIENGCELSLPAKINSSIFYSENNIQSYMRKIKNNFKLYWKECDYHLKELQKNFMENEKLIKDIICENSNVINNKYIDNEMEEKMKTKIERKRKILSNIMNIRLIYRIIEMYLFTMRQFSYLLKEINDYICLILDEHKIMKNNYEMVIGNLLKFEAKNYEDVKYTIEKKILRMQEFFKNKNESIYSRDEFSYLYTLKCLQHEISERVDAKTDLRLLMIKKREYSEKFMKENQRKIISFDKLSSFKKSIKCIIDKYSSLDIELSKYLSTFYYKIFNHQIELNINNVSILNNKKPFNFLFPFKDQSNNNDVFNYMNYDAITKIRKNNGNSHNCKEIHSEYIALKFYTKDNFDISILPDLKYLSYLNVEIEISYLYSSDCLVAKTNSIEFIGLHNGRKLLSDIYSNQDHFLLFSKDINDFQNFKYGFPFLWLNAMAEKPYVLDIENEISQKDESNKKNENNNTENFQNNNFDKKKLLDIYNWHLNRTLDISVLFSKIFTRILFRIWDIWQIRHYKYYPNVFPPFTYEKHLEALKKIQSVSLQQISYFDIITEESYLKEETENINGCGKDNIYACCFIQLYESCLVKAFISIPFNGKEPYFSVFLTKKKYSRRLKKLQDYLNTTVVNKHSKVEDTQRQIILTLQLAKLREGAHKYFKSFSKNSTMTFDEDIS